MLEMYFDFSNFKYFEGVEFSHGLRSEDWITIHENTVNGLEYFGAGDFGIPYDAKISFEEDSLLMEGYEHQPGEDYVRPNCYKRVPYQKIELISLFVQVENSEQRKNIAEMFEKYGVTYMLVNPESGEVLFNSKNEKEEL